MIDVEIILNSKYSKRFMMHRPMIGEQLTIGKMELTVDMIHAITSLAMLSSRLGKLI